VVAVADAVGIVVAVGTVVAVADAVGIVVAVGSVVAVVSSCNTILSYCPSLNKTELVNPEKSTC
jgi:hypothetical protein